MIFVTVGTHNQGMDRLVRKMDELASRLGEEVVIQRGHTTYEPHYARSFAFTAFEEMIALTRNARVVVTHDGAAAMMIALKYAKPTVVVPRQFRYREHLYQNKMELALELAAAGLVTVVYEVNDLEEAVARAAPPKAPLDSRRDGLVAALRQYLETLEPRENAKGLIARRAPGKGRLK